MLRRVQNACLLLFAVGASTAFAGCTEDCVDGYCVPAYDTGYYYDSLVSGIEYSTVTTDGITRTGVTGENGDPGSFSWYAEGADVSFSLGATDLGTAPAAQKLTPFELAGVTQEAVGGCDVSGALPDDKFRIVHNLAVLLQTLDTDGDPTNGIEISTEVAALFEKVTVNLDQAWTDFQADSDLEAVINKAKLANLLPEARTLVTREDALKALYEGIGLCPSGA